MSKGWFNLFKYCSYMYNIARPLNFVNLYCIDNSHSRDIHIKHSQNMKLIIHKAS